MAKNEVIIEHDGNGDYILVILEKGQIYFPEHNNKYLALVSMQLDELYDGEWDRLHALEKRTKDHVQRDGTRLERLCCDGRLAIDRKAKTIRTYNNRTWCALQGLALNLVETVLRENFPDYKLDIK